MKDTSKKEKKKNKQKDEMELVAKFKSYEKQLLDLLKIEPVEFDEKTGKATVKKNIKNYIQRVEQAKIILNEYEKTANELGECVSAAAENSEAYAKAVIKLRKEPKVKKQSLVEDIEKQKDDSYKNDSNVNPEYENEVTIVDGKATIVSKKSKKIKGDSKQF